ERLLMEQLDYTLLFRWFVGLEMDDPVWNATVFTKNRERLLAGEIARAFFDRVVAQARERGLLSDEHFTVDGTLVEAWASLKSFKRKDAPAPPPDDPGNPTVNFHGERRSNATHASTTDPDARLLGVTPHVGQNTSKRASAIDGRTTRHRGYRVSQRRRKRVEEIFGWLKTVGLMRKTRHRGTRRVDWMFTFTLAVYNLVRIRNLTSQTV